VNVSPRNLNDASLPIEVEERLADRGMPPGTSSSR
jgi:hypothetical protein